MIFTSDYSMKMPFGQAVATAVVGILTVMLILAVIDLLIILVSKAIRKIESNTVSQDDSKPIECKLPPLPKTQSQGAVKLIGVDEPTAAIIMAIVSHQSGIPLNRLQFESIKQTEENR